MSIEKKCENCERQEHCFLYNKLNAGVCEGIVIKEKLIRQDERSKIIRLIEKNKKQFHTSLKRQLYKNGEVMQNYKHAIDDYLYLLIEEIKKEQ